MRNSEEKRKDAEFNILIWIIGIAGSILFYAIA